MNTAPGAPQESGQATAEGQPADSPPFRFYDNRQKYLAFVNTCNEKAVVARRAAQELSQLRPHAAGACGSSTPAWATPRCSRG